MSDINYNFEINGDHNNVDIKSMISKSKQTKTINYDRREAELLELRNAKIDKMSNLIIKDSQFQKMELPKLNFAGFFGKKDKDTNQKSEGVIIDSSDDINSLI